jgi:hypothetical protein
MQGLWCEGWGGLGLGGAGAGVCLRAGGPKDPRVGQHNRPRTNDLGAEFLTRHVPKKKCA